MAFGIRVRNALRAEPRSVKLSSLVGAGGLWYGFGKMIAEMWVNYGGCWAVILISNLQINRRAGPGIGGSSDAGVWPLRVGISFGSDDDLRQTFRGRLTEVIDQAQHFAALGPAGGGGTSSDVTQSFREGLDGTEREREVEVFNPHHIALTCSQYSCWHKKAPDEQNVGTKTMIKRVGEWLVFINERALIVLLDSVVTVVFSERPRLRGQGAFLALARTCSTLSTSSTRRNHGCTISRLPTEQSRSPLG